MRPPKQFPEGSVAALKALLKQARTLNDYRRIQAVLMRASGSSTPVEIAQATGLTVNTVRIIHSRFLREGIAFLVNRPGRGGRRRSILSEQEKQEFLARFCADAAKGGVVEASAIKRAYEERVGHPVAASTIYRMLAAAGWRKIVPRPSHPKKNPESEAEFKKSSRHS